MVWEDGLGELGGEVDFDVVLEAGWGLLAPGGLHARRISVEFRIFDQMYRFLALYSVFLDKYSVFLNIYSVFLTRAFRIFGGVIGTKRRGVSARRISLVA